MSNREPDSAKDSTRTAHRRFLADSRDMKPADHNTTVVRLDGPHADAWYVLDDADSMGLHLTRYVDGEESHEETFTWNETARFIRNHTMRIYDMTDEEVDNLG